MAQGDAALATRTTNGENIESSALALGAQIPAISYFVPAYDPSIIIWDGDKFDGVENPDPTENTISDRIGDLSFKCTFKPGQISRELANGINPTRVKIVLEKGIDEYNIGGEANKFYILDENEEIIAIINCHPQAFYNGQKWEVVAYLVFNNLNPITSITENPNPFNIPVAAEILLPKVLVGDVTDKANGKAGYLMSEFSSLNIENKRVLFLKNVDALSSDITKTDDKINLEMELPDASVPLGGYTLTFSGEISGHIRCENGTVVISGRAVGLVINSINVDLDFTGTGYIVHNGKLLFRDDVHLNNKSVKGSKSLIEQNVGNFIFLNGIDSEISIPDNPSLNFGTEDAGIELVFRTSKNYSSGAGYILNKGEGSERVCVYVNTDNRLVFELQDDGAAVAITSNEIVNDGNIHIAIPQCDRSGNISIMLDGIIQDDTKACPSNTLTSTENLYLGRDNAGNNRFCGELHQVRMWNRLFTAAESEELSSNILRALAFSDFYGKNAELNTDSNAIADNATESDATTGWTSAGIEGSAVFQSQSATVAEGSYAFEINANPTPASYARIYKDIETDWGLIHGKKYRLTFKWRHHGTGDDWAVEFGDTNLGGNVQDTIVNTEIDFQEKEIEFIHSEDTKFLVFQEANVAGNGGIYLDDLSIKQIGCMLYFSPESVGIEGDKWIDQSSNKNHGIQTAKPAKENDAYYQQVPIGSLISLHPDVDISKVINAAFWKYCDGVGTFRFKYSDGSESADIAVPPLTDDRFLMGGSAAGTGGSNFLIDHTHGCGNQSADHSHTTGIGTPGSGTESADHSHAVSIGVNNTTGWGGVIASYAGPVQGQQASTYGRSPGHTHSTSIGSPTSGGVSASHNHAIGSGSVPTSTSSLPKYFKVKYFLRIK
ncbi:hypothetical protein KKI24_28905 [bacterium]|nr:hypothetical protein [bacterium]